MVRELIKGITREAFSDDPPVVIGTGGFSRLFENARLFETVVPTLVLDGLRIAYELNHTTL